MPDITFNLTGTSVDDFINDWVYAIGYTDTITVDGLEVTNPISKQDFIINQFIVNGKSIVLNYRLEQAKIDMVESIKSDLDSITVEM